MRRVLLTLVAMMSLVPGAAADASDDDKQVVLINAGPKVGDTGGVANVRRALDARGVLAELPESLQATLLGRSVAALNLDAIKDAFAKADYGVAQELIDADEKRILQNIASGDPTPALAELYQWRGLIAVREEDPDTAVEHFRAALRFNPAWTLDKKLAQPAVNRLVKKAKKPISETGRLRVEADQDGAMVEIDGGKAQPADGKLALTAGIHLVVVSAKGHSPYADLVEVEADQLVKLPISLDPETRDDKAKRLGAATIEAPPGKARLSRAKRLARVTSLTRYLVIEDYGENRLTLRVYDVGGEKVSRPLELDRDASSTTIYRKVMAALDPDNMIEPGNTLVIVEHNRRQRWYERWYVWVGIGALVGGSAITYHHATRDPVAVRF